ncbi:MAG: NifB/NifX family molybdenum-iron cluster-binding protein [Desulfovibrionaceae bacterium]|nr:NifB/NifX family molybdenum-iron cluster-binding protein [Desulfovibrionaceae bacterium]
MDQYIIAVPSANPGGLEAAMGMHFGHCELFTLITIQDGAVSSVETMPNVPHAHGGCIAPVQVLAERGVSKLLAGGMGFRPLMGLMQSGIEVFHTGSCATVGDAVTAFLKGELPAFSTDFTCRGGH